MANKRQPRWTADRVAIVLLVSRGMGNTPSSYKASHLVALCEMGAVTVGKTVTLTEVGEAAAEDAKNCDISQEDLHEAAKWLNMWDQRIQYLKRAYAKEEEAKVA